MRKSEVTLFSVSGRVCGGFEGRADVRHDVTEDGMS